jgi:hypothetical protein
VPLLVILAQVTFGGSEQALHAMPLVIRVVEPEGSVTPWTANGNLVGRLRLLGGPSASDSPQSPMSLPADQLVRLSDSRNLLISPFKSRNRSRQVSDASDASKTR